MIASPIPAEHACIVISAAGGPQVLLPSRAPVPVPLDDEVLIAVKAAGVNRHDCNQRQRGPTPAHSDVPGLEVAGEVVALGAGVRGLAIGDSVCALCDGGGYAEYTVAKAGQVLPLPDGLDFEQGAALPEGLFTIWHNIFRVAGLGPAESVLLHGGTSGVGTLALQVLRSLGHPVFATCGTPEKVGVALRLGATRAFDYTTDDFVAGVLDATRQRGVDMVLDMSGGRYSVQNLKAMARRGRLVHLSPGKDAEFRVPLRDIMTKELRITGTALRPLPNDEKNLIATELRRALWPLLESGAIKPVLHRLRPLAEAADAHAEMEAGQHIGKLVLMTGTS